MSERHGDDGKNSSMLSLLRRNREENPLRADFLEALHQRTRFLTVTSSHLHIVPR